MPITTPFPTPPEHGTAIEIAPGIFWARLPLPMALDHVNVFVLDDGPGWTVVDTGFATSKTRQIWQELLSGPFAGKPVHRVIGTHHHPDHIGLAGWFIDQGASLSMTRTAWLMARMLTLDEQPRPSPEALDFYKRAGMDATILEERKNQRPFNFADCVDPIPQGFTRIQEGDTVDIGGRNWTVRIGHGHAPEHATLWCEEDDIILGGDQLLLSISPNLGVYPTEPDANPVGEWLDSCRRFQAFATDKQLVLGGHKLPYYGLSLRLEQMIGNHIEALNRLLDHLDRPRSAGECFVPIFKRSITGSEYGLALVEAVAHLNHLHQTGLATRHKDTEGVYRFMRVS